MVLASFASLAWPVAGASQTTGDEVTLTLEQARAVARQSLQAGNFEAAAAISESLLAQNPDDADMLVVRALLARRAGDAEATKAAAERAYRISDNPNVKFDAAACVCDFLFQPLLRKSC